MPENLNEINKTLSTAYYKVEITDDTEPSVSKGNIKIGKGIYSFSLLPGDEPITTSNLGVLTDVVGTCGGVCSDCKLHCYAMRDARLHHNATIPAWTKNTLLMRKDLAKLMEKLNAFIKKHKVKEWRWQVAGEIESYEYLEAMNNIAIDNPTVKFGCYTKRFELVQRFLNEHQQFASNLCINISEWNHNTDGYNFEKLNKFVWDDGNDPEIAKLVHCPAVSKPTKPGGKGRETGITCDQCGRCYNTTGKSTAVYNH